MRQVQVLPPGKTNLCQAIRATQGKGLMPDGSSRFSKDGKPIYHYMGTSTFSEYTVLPEISVGENQQGRTAREGLPARLRRDHRYRRGDEHRQGGSGRHGGDLRPRRHRPVGDHRRSHGQGLAHRRRRHNPAKFEIAKQLGATECINPLDHDKPIQDVIVDLTDGGVDYSFECIGNVKVMRSALECCHRAGANR